MKVVETEEVLDNVVTKNGVSFEYKMENIKDYFSGCEINGESIFPCAGYLVLAWHALSKLYNTTMNQTPILFKKISFKKTILIKDLNDITVTILPGSGNFEICCKEKVIVSGNVQKLKDMSEEKLKLPAVTIPNIFPIDSEDVYKELAKRGYNYKANYKTVVSSNLDMNIGKIIWLNNWVVFFDAILQFDVLSKNTHDLYAVESIDRLLIDPKAHITATSVSKEVHVYRYENRGVITSGGLEMTGLKWKAVPKVITDIEFDNFGHVNGKKNDVVKLENVLKKVDRAHAISTSGDLSSIQWVESPPLEIRSGEELCHVYYTSLNHQDLVYATERQWPRDEPRVLRERTLGMEFSGYTASGRRVMGLVSSGALATEVIADETCLWDLPPHWPLDCAVTVPMAFFTAYYALLVQGEMKPKDVVVVYCGATDIGYAAIHLAVLSGCRVFSTHNCRDQRQYIISKHLEVSDLNNGQDWHPDFENMVLERTGVKGADIVLNLLGPKKLPAAASCLAKGGKLLDLVRGRRDEAENVFLPPLTQNQSYQSINMASLTQKEKQTVSSLLAEGIKVGDVIYTMHQTAYPVDNLEEAFKSLTMDDQIGKVTISIRNDDSAEKLASKPSISAVPRTYMDAEKSYIVIGGKDTVTMDFGHWLISRGATRIVFATDNKIITGYQTLCVKRWQEQGKKVEIVLENAITSSDEAAYILIEARKFGPIGGIFDLGTFGVEYKDEVVKTAVKGVKILDQAIREQAEEIDHFVVLTTLNGDNFLNPLKKVMGSRRKLKLPGIVIQFKSLGDENKEHFSSNLDFLLMQPHSLVTCEQTLKKTTMKNISERDNLLKIPYHNWDMSNYLPIAAAKGTTNRR